MFLYFAFICLWCNFVAKSEASGCEDITGRWKNQLGSEVQFDHTDDGRLKGKYFTKVSKSGGKLLGHDLLGALPYNKPGSSFAFSVSWNNGTSTTIWTAQCQICDGKEMIETSWLLRSYVDSCIDKWKSTLIGKDIFTRKLSAGQSRKRRGVSEQNSVPESMNGNNNSHPCNVQGIWYNDVGSEIILNQTKDGEITGEYRTAVEVKKGSAGTTHSLIYGAGAHGDPNSTFSLLVVWRMGASVTGWVGQCHICGENKTVVLEMNWLLRSKVDSCSDVWKSTMYGTNTFTRHEQKGGPRKSDGTHTPNRDGEDNDTSLGTTRSGVPTMLLVSVILVQLWK